MKDQPSPFSQPERVEFARIQELLQWCQPIYEQLGAVQGLFRVRPGSQLAFDDAATSPFQISHHIGHSLLIAYDHLDCLASLLATESPRLYITSLYTLTRGALEAAATSLWLTCAPTQRERIKRVLALEKQEIVEERKALDRVLKPETPRHGLAKREQLIDEIKNRELDPSDSINYKVQAISTIIKTAGDYAKTPTGPITAWQACSGFTHGRRWTTTTFARFDDHSSSSSTPVVSGLVSLRVEALRVILEATVHLTREATIAAMRAGNHPLPVAVKRDPFK